ncbi:MAG: MarR family winged helix-turn-helix transcriptional regulator [Bacilli bacterium]|jgi:DNA-binding MarR family transcriptional regulator
MIGKISLTFGKVILTKKIMINNIFKETNVYYGQHLILEVLSKNDGITQVEIASKLGVTAASVALSTKRMEKNGLLCKKVDETNLRCKKLYITKKGLDSLKKIHKEIKKFNNKMFEGFTEKEIENLSFYLDKIMRNVINDKVFEDSIENIIKTMDIDLEN